MIRRILSLIVMVVALVSTASAQENVYLIKGDKVVAKYSINDVDYVSFHLPDGVSESPVTVAIDQTGKNYITYSINTLSPATSYAHCVVLKSTVDYLLQEYYDCTLETATEENMNAVINACMYSYGYEGKGTDTYTMKDGMDGLEVLAGQEYMIFAWQLDEDGNLTGSPISATTTTLPAGESAEKLTVTYGGLDEKGNAIFAFDMGSDIQRVHTAYGRKSVMEQFVQAYGYEYLMFTFGEIYNPSELTGENATWPVYDEDDYVLYALGIDSNGDWVKAETSAHIVPAATEKGPQINILDKTKGNGSVNVSFEITPSNVSEAYVRLMDENTADDRLNMGYTMADLAAGGDAEDITSTINSLGEYRFKADNLESGWYSLFIMGRNEDGTTVTRINFHSDLEGSQWDLNENIAIKAPARVAKFAKMMKKGNKHALRKMK